MRWRRDLLGARGYAISILRRIELCVRGDAGKGYWDGMSEGVGKSTEGRRGG
jgi:hypothetical protein